MAQGVRHKDSRNGIHRGLLDTAVLPPSGRRTGCRIDQRKGREEHNGEETDESDAEWLMLLHQYGLLKASFQPHNDAKRMRTLTRHRDTLSREASSIVLRMQKAMQQMNIKLTLVLSDITGKSGIRIIEAILAGERDPKRLADLADIQCKTPKEEIAKALEGNWEEDLMFVLRQTMILSNIIVPNLASAMQNWRNSWKTTVRRLPKWKILHIARQKTPRL